MTDLQLATDLRAITSDSVSVNQGVYAEFSNQHGDGISLSGEIVFSNGFDCVAKWRVTWWSLVWPFRFI